MTYAVGALNGNWKMRWDDRDLKSGEPLPHRRQLEVRLEAARQMERAGHPGAIALVIKYSFELQLLILSDELQARINRNSDIVCKF